MSCPARDHRLYRVLSVCVLCSVGRVLMTCCMFLRGARYATILAFDVKVTADARDAAAELGVRIFTADIIYHLTDQFDAYLKESVRALQEAAQAEVSFPCVLRIIPTAIFNAKNPIVMGVDVVEGSLRIGTPICVLEDGKTEVRRAVLWRGAVVACCGGLTVCMC